MSLLLADLIMPRISLSAASLLIIAMLVLCTAEENVVKEKKYWPDFSCYGVKRDPEQSSYNLQAPKYWNECLEEEEDTGVCAKVCVLNRFGALWKYIRGERYAITDGPPEFEVVILLEIFQLEKGYGMAQSPADWDIEDKVKEELLKCKDKFPNFHRLNVSSSCEPWEKVLDCMDKAWTCMCRGR